MSTFWRDTDVKFKDTDVVWTPHYVTEELLAGFSAGQSIAFGTLTIISQLAGFSAGQSIAFGTLTIISQLAGFSAGQSIAFGTLTIILQLAGSSAGQSIVSGSLLKPIQKLSGSSVGQSIVWGSLYEEAVLGFYQTLTNKITTYFQNIAILNNFVVRYDGDPRLTPTSGAWCNVGIDYGETRNLTIGKRSKRLVGIFNVQIKTPIGIGTADALDIADIIIAGFKGADELPIILEGLPKIIFQVPRIEKVGRVEDNYQYNVICPFYADKIYSKV